MDLTKKLGPKMTAPKMTAPKVLDRAGAAVFHLKNKKVLVVFFALVAFLGLVAIALPGTSATTPPPPAPVVLPVTTAQAKAVARTVGRSLLDGARVSPALLSASLAREIARPAASPPIPEALSQITTTLVAHQQGQWLYRVTATVGQVKAAVEVLVEAAPHPIVVGVAGLST
ncbi:MAG: hypothetical protein ACYCST_07205 [Acidimicrobiales bacterium]